jgi:hypothetical protein
VDSLVRLSRLEPKQLEEAVKQGKVKPDMGRHEVKTVLLEYRPASKKIARKEPSSEAAIPTPPAILEELRNLLIPVQEALEDCQERQPGSPEDLICILEAHANWLKGLLEKLRSSAKESINVEAEPDVEG